MRMLANLVLAAPFLLVGQVAPEITPVARGQKIFAKSCAMPACHAPIAQTKTFKLLERSRPAEEVMKITREGSGGGKMPGFAKQLREEDLKAVAAYVVSVTKGQPAAAAAAPAMPEQAARGQKLFFEAEGGSRCGHCHALGGQGTPAGPDLARLAALSPRAIKMAVLATATQYVVIAKLKAGTSFPAMRIDHSDSEARLYDLSTVPPQLKTLPKTDIASFDANSVWKHPPESAKLEPQALADVIAYIRFVAKGDRRGVRVEEVE